MNDENKITEKLQLHIRYLERTLEDTKNKLEEAKEEEHKIFKEYQSFKEEYGEYKKVSEVLRKAVFSLFTLISAFIGIITAYGNDSDIFFKAFYLTSLSSIFNMLLQCIGSILYASILLLTGGLIFFLFEFDYGGGFRKPIVYLLVFFVLGIFIASVIIKKFFWFVGA